MPVHRVNLIETFMKELGKVCAGLPNPESSQSVGTESQSHMKGDVGRIREGMISSGCLPAEEKSFHRNRVDTA